MREHIMRSNLVSKASKGFFDPGIMLKIMVFEEFREIVGGRRGR